MRLSIRSVVAGLLAALVCAIALGAGACEKAEPSASEPAELPFGETFTAIEYSSKQRELVDPAGLEIEFTSAESAPVLSWDAGCGEFKARLVSSTEIDVRGIASTEKTCSLSRESRQRAAAALFESGPSWSLEDGVLTLRSGGDEIELYEERTLQEGGGEPPPFAAAVLEGAASEERTAISATSCVSDGEAIDAILDEGVYRFLDLAGRPTAICTAELADGREADALLIGKKRPHWLRGDVRAAPLNGEPPSEAASRLDEIATSEGEEIVSATCTKRRGEVNAVLGDPAYAAADYVAAPAAVCSAELGDGRLIDALLIHGDWFGGLVRFAPPRRDDELDCPEDKLRTGLFEATVRAIGLPTPARALASYLRFEDSDLKPYDFINYRKNRFRLRDTDGNDLADLRAVKSSGGYLIGRYEICGGALSR